MLESYAKLWRAYKDLETGKNKDFNRGRTEKIEKQNRELDRLHLVAMKKLVSAADVQRALEVQNANIRQKFVYLKALAPGLDGRPVNEIEKRLDEYARKCLRELDRSGEADARRPEDAEDAEETGAAPAPRKRRKKAGKGRG
jgi:sRNA-binding protein